MNDHQYQSVKSEDIYSSDEYISNNPSLHLEDSSWKLSLIIPLIDRCITELNKTELTILDVGGGAGEILHAVSRYIRNKYGIVVNKYVIDLSPGMLKLQKERNPDIINAYNEDIRSTSLQNKSIDITLMIDVIEHIPNQEDALKEIRRISRFVIFKTPLENNILYNLINLVTRGRSRRENIQTIGHVNLYTYWSISRILSHYCGRCLSFSFSNVSAYYLNSAYYRKNMKFRNLLINILSNSIYGISQRLNSLLFLDFIIVLVDCR